MNLAFTPSEAVRRIRDEIDHPVVDADGHLIEYLPVVRDKLRDIAGNDLVKRFDRHYWTMDHGYKVPAAIRQTFGISRSPWWTFHAKQTLDRATSTLPALQYERLDELGIDVAVCYPSYFIQFPVADNEDFRRAGCRAVNEYLAETYAGLGDRLIPVAAIPMHTPDEALAELRHVVENLGLRAIVMQGVIQRKEPSGRVWVDSLGHGSRYDYDPVWQYCQDHGIAATFHSSGMDWGSHASMTNFQFNHVGHFAAAGEATARSLLFGGVPVRFPRLRFAFLEGGLGWAAALFGQLSGNFAKRNIEAVDHYDPRHLDKELFRELFDRYATPAMKAHRDELEHSLLPLSTPMEPADEFADMGCKTTEDIAGIFSRSMFFGCEGDDPMNALASRAFGDSLGTRINAIYGSDVGHWDVRDMREVLEEVYELVEHGIFTPDDLRHLVFESPVRLWTDNRPDFFQGTRVADAVAQYRTQIKEQ